MISICLPTRKRAEHFKTMCVSALEFADNPNNVEFVSYHDKDDRTKYEFFGNHKEVVGNRTVGLFDTWNECQKVAIGPIYMFMADDFIFKSKSWDTKVLEAFDNYDDKIVLVCPDGDWWQRWNFGVIGFVHKNWVDAVGYLFPTFNTPNNVDKWVNELATGIGRQVRLKDIWLDNSNCKDRVHKTKRQKLSNWRAYYYSPEAKEQRELDKSKLLKAISEYKSQHNYSGSK